MNISVSLIIDDQTKDADNLNITTVSLNNGLTVLDIQNMYKQSDENDIYLICRGEIPKPDICLCDIGIIDGSCLKLVIKKAMPKNSSFYNEESIKEIVKKHRHMMKTRFKQVVNDSLEKGLDTVMEDDHEVEKCLLAFSIASDHRLLRTLLGSTDNVAKLLRQCPVLIHPALRMINIIQERLHKCASQLASSSSQQDARYFSLGEVEHSDNEDDEEDGADSSENEHQSTAAASRAPTISRHQLRSAISHSAPRPPVSLSQLRSAIEGAIGVQPEPMEVDPPSSGVDQLVAMGFLDREANRAALEACAGDVEAAVEFLLG